VSDYPPPNFRDVGEALSLFLPAPPIPYQRLFRGGRIDSFTTPASIGNARTILNLRRGPDPDHLDGIRLLHVPADDTLENYDTANRLVRRWVEKALSALASPDIEFPVYIHCTAGKDRTGIVVAALLTAIGVEREIVVEEYLLSDGVERAAIEGALDGLGDVRRSLRVDVDALTRALTRR
jgi:protein-tyrosine phosphatase